jgi:hypothetical protein
MQTEKLILNHQGSVTKKNLSDHSINLNEQSGCKIKKSLSLQNLFAIAPVT